MWLGAKACDSFQNWRGWGRVESSHPGKEEQADPLRGRVCVAFSYPLWCFICYRGQRLRIRDWLMLHISDSGVRCDCSRRKLFWVKVRVRLLGFLPCHRPADKERIESSVGLPCRGA